MVVARLVNMVKALGIGSLIGMKPGVAESFERCAIVSCLAQRMEVYVLNVNLATLLMS